MVLFLKAANGSADPDSRSRRRSANKQIWDRPSACWTKLLCIVDFPRIIPDGVDPTRYHLDLAIRINDHPVASLIRHDQIARDCLSVTDDWAVPPSIAVEVNLCVLHSHNRVSQPRRA